VNKPMGVATYKLLPEEIREKLPSMEELEAGLAEDDETGSPENGKNS